MLPDRSCRWKPAKAVDRCRFITSAALELLFSFLILSFFFFWTGGEVAELEEAVGSHLELHLERHLRSSHTNIFNLQCQEKGLAVFLI